MGAAEQQTGEVREEIPFTTASERADRRWRRALAGGLLLAVMLHVAFLFSVRSTTTPESPFTAAGPDQGGYRAAEGGSEGLAMIEIRLPAAPVAEVEEEEVEVEPVPVPEPIPEPVIEPEPVTAPEFADEEIEVSLPGAGEAGTGGEAGERTGPGTDAGEGEGGGGADDSGDAGLIAPRPRGILIPPSGQPASARGQEITVWVFVAADGRVLADSTRLDPPTSDRRYNNRLRQTVSDWVFEPARRAGQAVAAWYPFQIIL